MASKRRAGAFLTAVIVAWGFATPMAPRAEALHQTCLGSGVAWTGAELRYPRVRSLIPFELDEQIVTTSLGFSVDASASVCLGGGLAGSATLTGNCMSFVATMSTNVGPASMTGVGAVVIVSGSVTGAGLMLPDATTNEDCAEFLSSGADRFRLALVLTATA